MVFSVFRNKAEKQKGMVSAQEAFNLWDVLRSEYMALELVKIWKNDAHDKDLKLLIGGFEDSLRKNVLVLEKKMMAYSIVSPDRNRTAINFPRNSKAIVDEFIASELFLYLQESIEHHLRAFRTSITNDTVRTLFRDLVLDMIKKTDKIIQYLKLKGWIETPPLYKDIPKDCSEKISCIEVSNLWDHLAFRYDNINTSQVIILFCYDGDLKLTLEIGKKVLNKQIKMLETELAKFGVPLPKRTGQISITPENTEVLKDDHMFRTLLTGMQGAAMIHSHPIKECTFNDRVRKLFIDLLIQEMDLLDKYFKFGKVKGWLHEEPMYGP